MRLSSATQAILAIPPGAAMIAMHTCLLLPATRQRPTSRQRACPAPNDEHATSAVVVTYVSLPVDGSRLNRRLYKAILLAGFTSGKPGLATPTIVGIEGYSFPVSSRFGIVPMRDDIDLWRDT